MVVWINQGEDDQLVIGGGDGAARHAALGPLSLAGFHVDTADGLAAFNPSVRAVKIIAHDLSLIHI